MWSWLPSRRRPDAPVGATEPVLFGLLKGSRSMRDLKARPWGAVRRVASDLWQTSALDCIPTQNALPEDAQKRIRGKRMACPVSRLTRTVQHKTQGDRFSTLRWPVEVFEEDIT